MKKYKHFPSKRGIRRKREIDRETIGTNLYVSDKRILDEEVGRKKSTRSEVLREVFHEYASKKRLAPDAPDTPQETALMVLQKKTAAEVAEARKELQTALKEISESRRFQENVSELNETEFQRLFRAQSDNFNLLAQLFAVVWAVLEFVNRFLVIPMMRRIDEFKDDPITESENELLEARQEGFQLVEKFRDDIKSQLPLRMVLAGWGVAPEGTESGSPAE